MEITVLESSGKEFGEYQFLLRENQNIEIRVKMFWRVCGKIWDRHYNTLQCCIWKQKCTYGGLHGKEADRKDSESVPIASIMQGSSGFKRQLSERAG